MIALFFTAIAIAVVLVVVIYATLSYAIWTGLTAPYTDDTQAGRLMARTIFVALAAFLWGAVPIFGVFVAQDWWKNNK